jgi:hypothetical protein
MNLTSIGTGPEAAPACRGAAADRRAFGSDDAAARRRLREALRRELAVAIATGDRAACQRLRAALRSTRTT